MSSKISEIVFDCTICVKKNGKFFGKHIKGVFGAKTTVELTIDLKGNLSGVLVVVIGRDIELVVLRDRIDCLASLVEIEVAIVLDGNLSNGNEVGAVAHAVILPNLRPTQAPRLKNTKFHQDH